MNEELILLSLESPETREYFSGLFKDYRIVPSNGGEETVNLAAIYLPDLVIMSSNPGNNGQQFQYCRQIKNDANTKDIPVVFISDSYNSSDLANAFDAGASDYIVMSGEVTEIVTRIGYQLKLKKSGEKISRENTLLKKLLVNDRKLISIGAHDLKNPLKVIHGFSKLIEGRYSNFTQDDIFEFVKDIRESSEVMIKIISDILDIINYEKDDIALSWEELNLIELLNMVILDHAEVAYSKNIQINLVDPGSRLVVISDFAKLRQIFENLISNALKFSSFNKNVTIKLEELVINEEQQAFRVYISDEGPGIKPQELDHIFEIFSQMSNTPTANEYSTRLGMAIVKRLSEILDISIDIKSLVGCGTTFILTIPVGSHSPEIVPSESIH